MKGTLRLSLHREMWGFTLIELVVAIGIVGAVVTAASLAVVTLLRLTPPTRDYMVAYQQVQNAGYWLLKDINMSYNVTVGDGNPTLLILKQRHDPTTEVIVIYECRASNGSYKLVRIEDDAETVVAEHIKQIPPCNPDTRAITVTLTAKVGKEEVTTTYKAVPRLPAEEE